MSVTAEQLQKLSRELSDRGKLIEAGWVGLRAVWLHPDSPPNQVEECRWAFMAGAQHLFTSIMTILEPGGEPTHKDLERMDLIAKELRDFAEQVVKGLPTVGAKQ
jgi:hypothetical protein